MECAVELFGRRIVRTCDIPSARAAVEEVYVGDTYGLRQRKSFPGTIVDIGANIGAFSICANHAAPMSRLVAIEAHPATYECLCKNLFGLTTEIHNVALGDGSMVSCAYEPHGTGRSLFVNDSAGSVKSMGLKEMFDAFSIKGPDVLLKVDCEGGERVLLDNPQDAEIINNVASVVMELHLCCPAWPPFNHLPGEERWKEFFNACRHKKKEWRGSTIGNCAMIKLEGL